MRCLDVERLKRNIESRIGADVESGRVGCAAVAVRQDGQLLYEGFFGCSDLRNAPLRKDAIYRIASMTKPITAVAVLKLVEEGKLSLDTRVDRYLPEYGHLRAVRQNSAGDLMLGEEIRTPVTLWHLLTHTSGIGGGSIGSAQMRLMSEEQRSSLDQAVSYYAGAGLQFEPGSAVLYSGVPAFDVAAAVVEKVTDRPYEDFLKEHIFVPCRMEDTTFSPTAEQWERMVTVHDYVNGQAIVGETHAGCVFVDLPTTHPLGGAGLISTLDDYSNFAEMLLRGGCFEGNRVLTEKSVRLMATPQVSHALQPKPKRWGLAVKVVTDESYGRLPVGAFGWSGAYGTHFWVDPANRITAVYMKNSHYDSGGDAVTANNFEEDVTAALAKERL